MKLIPKEANCGSFVSCVPNSSEYDGIFNAGVLYNIFWDTIINPDGNGALIKTIVGFNKASREGSVISKRDRRKYLGNRDLLQYVQNRRFDWIEPVLTTVLDMNSKIGWSILLNYSNNQPDVWI